MVFDEKAISHNLEIYPVEKIIENDTAYDIQS